MKFKDNTTTVFRDGTVASADSIPSPINKPNIIFPVNIMPPHVGHLLALNKLLTIGNNITIVVYDNDQVMPINNAIFIFGSLLKYYSEETKKRIKIIKSKENFATMNNLPEEMMENNAFFIATTSRHIYSNLKIKGYPYTIFVEKTTGWCDFFYRIAFRRSLALFEIENIIKERR